MLSIVIRRLLSALPVLAIALIFTFVLARCLPGDPAAHLASGMAATPEGIAAMRRQMGLDAALPIQFERYVAGLLRGDWGYSFVTGEPVLHALWQRLPASIELTACGFFAATILGLPLGIAAACHVGRWPDHLCRVITAISGSLPGFFVGLLLIWLFYFKLAWLPEPAGRVDPFAMPAHSPWHTGFLLIDTLRSDSEGAWTDAFMHLLLPACTMAVFGLAPIARMTRSTMLSALRSDPVRTAHSLGLATSTILIRYALRSGAPAIVTTLGVVLSYMLGANVAIEKVFDWPGIGRYALDALTAADYAPLQGFVLCIAILFAIQNLLVDVLLAWLDPQAKNLR